MSDLGWGEGTGSLSLDTSVFPLFPGVSLSDSDTSFSHFTEHLSIIVAFTSIFLEAGGSHLKDPFENSRS